MSIKFPYGSKVLLREDSRFYGQSEGTVGTVIEDVLECGGKSLDRYEEMSQQERDHLWMRVQWGHGDKDGYQEKDLEHAAYNNLEAIGFLKKF